MVLVAELGLAVHADVEIVARQTLVAMADDITVAHVADDVRVQGKILPGHRISGSVLHWRTISLTLRDGLLFLVDARRHQRCRLLAYNVKTGLGVGHRLQKASVVIVRSNTDLVPIVICGW